MVFFLAPALPKVSRLCRILLLAFLRINLLLWTSMLIPSKPFVVKHKTPSACETGSFLVPPSFEERDKHVEELWRTVAPEWQRARNNGQVQALWPLLTCTCDSFYRWFAGLGSSKNSACRGLPGSPSRVRVPPPRCHVDDNATSVKNAACQRFVRALEHVARLRLSLAEDVTSSSCFHEFQHHWSRIVARAPKFVSTSLWTQLFGGLSELRVSQPSSWPRHEHLVSLVRRLDSDTQLVVQSERSSRLTLWRQSCRRNGVILLNVGTFTPGFVNLILSVLLPSNCLVPTKSQWIPPTLRKFFGKNGSPSSVHLLSRNLLQSPSLLGSFRCLCCACSCRSFQVDR